MENKNKNSTSKVLVGLLVVAAFLVGSLWTKARSTKEGSSKSAVVTPAVTGAPARPTIPPFEAKKSNKPQVKFFVMAFCPYGIQAESGLEPVYQLLKDKLDWQPRYVIYKDYCARATADQKAECEKNYCLKSGSQTHCSMHGIAELNQDIREICAFKLGDLTKWWKFVAGKNKNCQVGNIETCWEKEAVAAGLDTSKIKTCFNNEKVSLAKAETVEMEKYDAQGSPMVFVNEVIFNGGRAPEDYKKAICASFTQAPEECQTVLGSETSGVQGGCN